MGPELKRQFLGSRYTCARRSVGPWKSGLHTAQQCVSRKPVRAGHSVPGWTISAIRRLGLAGGVASRHPDHRIRASQGPRVGGARTRSGPLSQRYGSGGERISATLSSIPLSNHRSCYRHTSYGKFALLKSIEKFTSVRYLHSVAGFAQQTTVVSKSDSQKFPVTKQNLLPGP